MPSTATTGKAHHVSQRHREQQSSRRNDEDAATADNSPSSSSARRWWCNRVDCAFSGVSFSQSESHDVFEPRGASQVMWFERAYVYACFVERNVQLPLVFVAALTAGAQGRR